MAIGTPQAVQSSRHLDVLGAPSPEDCAALMDCQDRYRHSQAVQSSRYLDELGAVVRLLDAQRLLQTVALLRRIAKIAIGISQDVQSSRHLEVLRAVVRLLDAHCLLQTVALLRRIAKIAIGIPQGPKL
eukprot:3835581-Amphidinium_carterae.1